MKFAVRIVGSLIALVLAHGQTSCMAQSLVRGDPIILFDGNSMDGWAQRDGTPNDGWTIQDGTLHRTKRRGDLYFGIWFKDFELTFQWKLEVGGNSGLKYRVQTYGGRSLGCEYQIQDDDEINKQSAGGLYALYAPDPEKRKLNPPGEWNQGKIVVCGQHIEHWLNGERTVSADVGTLDWLGRVAESKFNDKQFFGQNQWGQIFLQDHGDPVWFRNIQLTPLVCAGASRPAGTELQVDCGWSRGPALIVNPLSPRLPQPSCRSKVLSNGCQFGHCLKCVRF